MKINATTRLLAANLPPEFLSIPNNTFFRKDIGGKLIRFGIDLNTAKFEEISSADAMRVLKGSKGLGVLFCFDRTTSSKTICTVIAAYKTSLTRYSAQVVSTTNYALANKLSPGSFVRDADIIYFVKGNQADYDRLKQQYEERLENKQFFRIDPEQENSKRYKQQLAERRYQTAKANASEIVKLMQDAIIRFAQKNLAKAEYSIGTELKFLSDKIEKAVGDNIDTKYLNMSTSTIINIATSDNVKDLYADNVNDLAKADMEAIRRELSRI